MAKYMKRVHIAEYNKAQEINAWEHSESLDEAGNGDSVIIPVDIKNISVTLSITSGSGKIQATTDTVETVLSETGIVWVDWDSGLVTANTQDSSFPVTAIRQVNASGTTKMTVRAQ